MRVLLNYVYYRPVGHVVEAMRYAKGLYDANPGCEIHVALTNRTAWELSAGCPWIAEKYTVELSERAPERLTLPPMPREWDYIIDNNLVQLERTNPERIRPDGYVPPPLGWEEVAMLSYYDLTTSALHARSGRGTLYPAISLPIGLNYAVGSHVRLEVPSSSRDFVSRYRHDGPKIGVMLGGSGASKLYPQIDSWIAILKALTLRYPMAKFFVSGTRAADRNQTTTRAYTDDDLARLFASDRRIVDCYDIGMWNQVALFELCDLLISPHTGFAFLALCVETPWLAISGGNWPEYFYNQVPFYSLLPDNPDYPYVGLIDGEVDGRRIPAMQPENLLPRIQEILDAVAYLLDPATIYGDALEGHRERVSRARVRRKYIPLAPAF